MTFCSNPPHARYNFWLAYFKNTETHAGGITLKTAYPAEKVSAVFKNIKAIHGKLDFQSDESSGGVR